MLGLEHMSGDDVSGVSIYASGKWREFKMVLAPDRYVMSSQELLSWDENIYCGLGDIGDELRDVAIVS